jgi:hypothetical protein
MNRLRRTSLSRTRVNSASQAGPMGPGAPEHKNTVRCVLCGRKADPGGAVLRASEWGQAKGRSPF